MADYGSYTCDSRNEAGSAVAKAVLSGKHKPEQPSDLRAFNITRSSITLAWKKNFDGGDPQKFRIRYRKDTMDPTYKYAETEVDATSVVLDGLEMATRYVINIQSFNQFGTEGFLREPLVVQTDFGFNEVNQLPIYTGNDLPLTIILVVCGVGTMLLLFNVALIVYLIKKRKKKGEAGQYWFLFGFLTCWLTSLNHSLLYLCLQTARRTRTRRKRTLWRCSVRHHRIRTSSTISST